MSIVIHTLNECCYCNQAKNFLTEHQLPFGEIKYDKTSENYQTLKNNLVNQTHSFTFPQIFINNVFLGGYQDLIHAYDTLTLHDLLKEIGILLDMDF
jgi:glutaredoxin